MEPLAYLYLTQEYEDSEIRELVFLRNWNRSIAGNWQRSGQVAVSLFSVASAAWLLGGAEFVLAEQAPKEFVPVIVGGKYVQSYAGGGYYYVLEDNEFDDRPAYAVVESSYPSGSGGYHPVRPDSSAAQSLCGVFKEGDSGEGVACLQELLQKAGYFDSAVTGYFGKITCDAVAAFQRDNGLYVDGVAGPQTLEALQRTAHSGRT